MRKLYSHRDLHDLTWKYNFLARYFVRCVCESASYGPESIAQYFTPAFRRW